MMILARKDFVEKLKYKLEEIREINQTSEIDDFTSFTHYYPNKPHT